MATDTRIFFVTSVVINFDIEIATMDQVDALVSLMHELGYDTTKGAIETQLARYSESDDSVGLLAELEKRFRKNSCLRFEVTSGDHREIAHHFYESRGYRCDERRFLKSP